jgi:hypothetical protein
MPAWHSSWRRPWPADAREVPFFDVEDRETATKLARKAVTALKKLGAPEMAVDVRDFTALAKAMLRIGTLALWLVSPENREAEAAIPDLQCGDALRPAVGRDWLDYG